MRALVTGGAGFIGSHTVDRLLAAGHDVRVPDNLSPPVHLDGVVPDYVPSGDVELIRGDVRDGGVWERALDGVEVVFHLAAYQDYLPDFSTFFHTNAVGTALLYEVAVQRRLQLAKVVVASSQAVYGEGSYRCEVCSASGVRPPPRDEARLRRGEWDLVCARCDASLCPEWTDESAVSPHNSYAISKDAAERLALALGRRYDIPTVAMRYSITQGSRQSFRNAYSGVLRTFAQRLLVGRRPVCYEDGRQRRDYVSVHDVVDANLVVLDDARADGRAFNVGGATMTTTLEYAALVADEVGTDLAPEVPGLYRVGDTRHIASATGALRELGWSPDRPVASVIAEYLEWVSTQVGFADHSAAADRDMRSRGTVRRADARGALDGD